MQFYAKHAHIKFLFSQIKIMQVLINANTNPSTLHWGCAKIYLWSNTLASKEYILKRSLAQLGKHTQG